MAPVTAMHTIALMHDRRGQLDLAAVAVVASFIGADKHEIDQWPGASAPYRSHQRIVRRSFGIVIYHGIRDFRLSFHRLRLLSFRILQVNRGATPGASTRCCENRP